jgi:hypothetical protein
VSRYWLAVLNLSVSVDSSLRQFSPLLHHMLLSGITPLHRTRQTVYNTDEVYALLMA